MVSSSLVLPVVFSAEQSCGVHEMHAVQQLSKAARRRLRHRRTAVLQAQHSSMKISEILQGGCAAEAKGEVANAAPGLEALLRLESKVDSVMQFLCCLTLSGRCVADPQVTDYGVPVKMLRKECEAVRTIQRAWRQNSMEKVRVEKRFAKVSLEKVRVESSWHEVRCCGCWEAIPVSCSCDAAHTCQACAPVRGKSEVPSWDGVRRGASANRLALASNLAGKSSETAAVVEGNVDNDGCQASSSDVAADRKEISESEHAAKYGNIYMRSVIGMVVAELAKSPQWQELPQDIKESTVQKCKRPYEADSGALYTGAHVRNLMESVGLSCGKAYTIWKQSGSST